ncbi:ATP-binding protein [Paractinoplanes lichenicola]|uniref:ATP-binding protein n=1 Tax=Paractinoplanes lichenicola TaxID=2802976 RepID=UPI0027DD57D1|nr:tetratricopeptide repeat protein [Actinoplanes lichenicola]
MPFTDLPDPSASVSLDDLVERLRRLKVWAGDPSYDAITERVNAAWRAAGRPASELARRSTVANCFVSGRRRFNTDLVLAVVEALHPDPAYVNQWRQALRVVTGESEAVAQVRVLDELPQDLATFTGRVRELDRLRLAAREGDAVVISAIEGMAGIGKTQLAVRAGHLLLRDNEVDRVLFVNLRGFHPDDTQPPADPSAVLDGFLRLLGVPGHQIPYGLEARAEAFRHRIAGTRALIVLDNAADAEQVRPLLPRTKDCLTLITSRRSLTELAPAIRLAVDAFTPDEALTYLAGALPDIAEGPAKRIAERCGYLPLALSLIAAHIRNTPGWTLADHADRLDERHRDRRLDSGVEHALDLSYRALPADRQRVLRLAALHPGQDFDAYAVAALTGDSENDLEALRDDHLLQETAPGRYSFHDLVRAYATGRAHDQDPPAARRAALTRLYDHYLATAAAAMSTLHPAEAHRRPAIPPTGLPAPDLSGREAATDWLDTERTTLLAVAAQAGPGHVTRLAQVLYRYFQGSSNADALIVHGHALRAANDSGDLGGQAHALVGIGIAHLRMGSIARGVTCLRQAVGLFRELDEPGGQALALTNLGTLAERAGRLDEAVSLWQETLTLFRRAGDRSGEAMTLNGLGGAMERAGRYPEAIAYSREALALAERAGNLHAEAFVLNSLGFGEMKAGELGPAGEHLRRALELFRRLGSRAGEATVLDSLGLLHTRLGRAAEAVGFHEEALVIVRENGDQDGEVHVLNGLGEATLAADRPADAIAHHTAALVLATELGVRGQQALAHAGLGRATGEAEHLRQALALYVELGAPDAEQIEAELAALQNAEAVGG